MRYKVELEREVWHQIRSEAISRGMTAGELVTAAVESYVSKSSLESIRERLRGMTTAELAELFEKVTHRAVPVQTLVIDHVALAEEQEAVQAAINDPIDGFDAFRQQREMAAEAATPLPSLEDELSASEPSFGRPAAVPKPPKKEPARAFRR